MNFVFGLNYVTKTIGNISGAMKKDKKDKTFYTNPLSCIIKLALCSYLKGPRISLYEHSILIQKSDYKQAFSRKYYGDSRKDLHKLLDYITAACDRYSLKYIKYRCKDEDNSEDIMENLIYIFTRAKKGIKNLQYLYKDDDYICSLLKGYVNIISDYIDDKRKITILDMEEDNKVIRELVSIWTTNNMNIMFGLFNELKKLNNNDCYEEISDIIDSSVCFTNYIDKLSEKIIVENLPL